ncbi:MAG: M20 family metallopeptidase, partial [Desulfobacterales bacterium]|nr:M20 family metallopeptidase [Desulfobacterales bacterium]
MDSIKATIDREVEALAEELYAVSDFLLANPETAYQEFKACAYLSRFLNDHGFTVEAKPGGLETAFLARPNGHKTGRPAVAILAEYDALPKNGHGCGHTRIAAASLGAALTLQRLETLPGAFAVVGTPAEEGGGGKAKLADAGVFDGLEAAMMIHPGQQNIPGKDMLGRIKFKMEFFGRTAHASGSPDRGLNALDALIQAYNSINALRQHLRPDGRVHGIITHGGDAPNIIPDYAAGLFYVRAGSRTYRDEIFERVQSCAQGAALATGTRCEITVEQPTIDPFRRNAPLEAAAAANMQALGLSIDPDDGRRGSSDIGNLSHVLPAIHPTLAIVE